MDPLTEWRKTTDLFGGVAAALAQRRRDGWRRQRLLEYQQARLRSLVGWAVARSPFYRELYRGIDPATCRLQELPVITKRMVIENFDRLVTDPSLTLEGAKRYIEDEGRPYYHLGRYRVFTTSGSTGQRGVFVYHRREWAVVLGTVLRLLRLTRPRGALGRAAIVAADSPLHLSAALGGARPFRPGRGLHLSATQPLGEIIRALDEHQPRALIAYATILATLAREQLAGRLHIRPRLVVTTAEYLRPEVRGEMARAWGVQPFDLYAASEGLLGCECPLHQGIHLQEDIAIVEVVDADRRPVPPGTLGQALLYTSLLWRTQPLIRYELSDMVTATDEPCPCGRATLRLRAVHGRVDDVLNLPGASGHPVPVNPYLFDELFQAQSAAFHAVREYQVVLRQGGLFIDIVLEPGAADPTAALEQAVQRALLAQGVATHPIAVRVVPALPRPADRMGKLAVVRSEV